MTGIEPTAQRTDSAGGVDDASDHSGPSHRRNALHRSLLTLAVLATLGIAACAPAPASDGGYLADGTVVVPYSGPVLEIGSSGRDVTLLQDRLMQLGYYTADTRGRFGSGTYHGFVAFQKAHGFSRTGKVDNNMRSWLNVGVRPGTQSRSGRVVEVDLARQIVILVTDGYAEYTFNTSTGRAGWSTPRGRYSIYRQIDGYRYAPLGTLYRPKYFNSGIAFHGSSSVPTYPDSHGCVRLKNATTDFFWTRSHSRIGTPVWVY